MSHQLLITAHLSTETLGAIQAKEPAISENAFVEMPSKDVKEGMAKGRLTYLWFKKTTVCLL